MAQSLLSDNNLGEAEKLLRAFLSENSNHPQALYMLAQIGIRSGAFQQVLPLLKKCEVLLPQKKELLLQLAQIQAELQLKKESSASYLKLIEKFPGWPPGLFSYAGFKQAQGGKDEAKELLLKTIEFAPKHCGAFLALSGLITFTSEDSLVLEMKKLLVEFQEVDVASAKQQMQLHYALGKVMADLAEYETAFEHWLQANKIQLSQCQFKVAQMKPFFTQIFEAFSEESLLTPTTQAENRLTPIFIIGLPRTGSTLLEQMLSSHSEISTAGEVNYVAQLIAGGAQKLTGANYPLQLEKLTEQQWLQLGDRYMTQLQKHAPQSQFIIDKLPANFQSVGLIQKALPHAVIVHLTRQTEAVALSVFRNYFQANEPYFCDLNEFSIYNQQYLELMSLWRGIYPDLLIELSYEELVVSPQIYLELILKQCHLPWQEGCLKYYETHSNVSTLSDLQVRQPVYHTSLDHWKEYASLLKQYLIL